MPHVQTTPWPSPSQVGAVLDDLLRSTGSSPARPPLTYLRRKPGRGLVAVYGSAGRDRRMFTVTVDEPVESPGGLNARAQAGPATRQTNPEGIVQVPDLGLTIQQFPHDRALPHLAEAMSPQESTALRQALSAAASRLDQAGGGPGSLTVTRADATPLRYKPGDRCVIRYHLRCRGSADGPREARLIGKLYRTPEQAHAAYHLLTRLWDAQGSHSWVPRPLGVAEPLALVITEDLGGRGDETPALMGTEVIRAGARQPTEALRQAATALAELHTSRVASPGTAARTGRDEAPKAGKRAASLSRYVPGLAERTATVAAAVQETLVTLPAVGLRPSHGSYKPSQLLYRTGSAHLVDFDQFCLADPSLDVGYFLAYLRPPGLWYGRAGTRAWFDTAAATFLAAYDEAAARLGMGAAERAAIARRCHAYEAALLLKIAARRPNRMHSARPGEVRAILEEAVSCLRLTRQGDAGPRVSRGSATRP